MERRRQIGRYHASLPPPVLSKKCNRYSSTVRGCWALKAGRHYRERGVARVRLTTGWAAAAGFEMSARDRALYQAQPAVLDNSVAGNQPYSINTPLTTSNFRIRASPAFQKTPINTVDVYVIYFQSTFNFPSWTSRVRSPSPV